MRGLNTRARPSVASSAMCNVMEAGYCAQLNAVRRHRPVWKAADAAERHSPRKFIAYDAVRRFPRGVGDGFGVDVGVGTLVGEASWMR